MIQRRRRGRWRIARAPMAMVIAVGLLAIPPMPASAETQGAHRAARAEGPALAATRAPAPVHLGIGHLPGASSISLGLVDADLFEFSSGAFRAGWLARASALGASFVRLTAYWRDVAPARLPRRFRASDPDDPNYNFSTLDSAVEAATAAGERVVLLVSDAPTWAQGSPIPAGVAVGSWEPSAADFAQFATALARRYSGHFSGHTGQVLPRVSYFQAWNEPDNPQYLMPQWERSGTGPWIATSPIIYRSLLNAFYSAVKSVEPSDAVLAAGLAPYGDPPGTGQGRMYPVTFLQQLFCLTPALEPSGGCSNPAHFDALDMHPYSISPTAHARVPGDISVPDLGKLSRIVRAALRHGLALPAGPKPLWVTELDWATVPVGSPSPQSLRKQARFLALGFYELWRQGVSDIAWFQLRDPPGQPNIFAGGGLYFGSGVAKPAAAAYRFPFVAIPASHHRLTIWGKAPTAGPVVIQKLVGGSWHSVLSLASTPGGIFYANHRLGKHLQLRALAGPAISPVWATSGPM